MYRVACSRFDLEGCTIARASFFDFAAVALIVALTGAPCYAGGPAACERIEYADARDWPIDKLEAGFCESGRAMYDAIDATKGLDPRSAAPFLRMANECLDREAMFRRVIENVHKRQAPACRR